jgi:hypothetical protein
LAWLKVDLMSWHAYIGLGLEVRVKVRVRVRVRVYRVCYYSPVPYHVLG